MPKLEYFLVADSIATDKERNTLSFFHVLEEWHAQVPLTIPQLVAVSSWRMDSDEIGRDFQASLDIRLPGAQSPDFEILPVNFTAEHRRHRTYHFVKGLRVDEAGEIEFRLLINGQHSASYFVWVFAEEENP